MLRDAHLHPWSGFLILGEKTSEDSAMGITGITYKLLIIGQYVSLGWEAEIPLEGDGKILTHLARSDSGTDIKKYTVLL